MCSEPEQIPDNSVQIAEIQAENNRLKLENTNYKFRVDSLETVKQKTKTQIVYREQDIDAHIAKDSSNSIVEYRKALQENNWLPDGTPLLTFREIGIGAKGLAKLPKMQLQVDIQQDQLNYKDEIITNQDFILKGKDDLIEIHELETKKWKQAYADEASFWNSKELWFGIGVVGTAAIIILSGMAK